MTALQKEFRAVAAHLGSLREVEHEETGTLYELGTFEGDRYPWEVVLLEIGMGNVGAAAEVERAIRKFLPEAVLVVGIAGALKDAARGDVVVAAKVYAYEPGKDSKTFLFRPEASKPSYRWLQRAKKEAREERWRTRIKPAAPARRPEVLVAPIVAGEKVLASWESTVFESVRATFNDAVAVEMESVGVMRAVHDNDIAAFIVRGISDSISDKAQADADGAQEVAAAHAAAFAFEVLAHMVPEGIGGPGANTTLLVDVEAMIRHLDFTGFSDEERPIFGQAFGDALAMLLHLREKLVGNQIVFQQERQMAADALEQASKKTAFEQARGTNQEKLKSLSKRLREEA